VYQHFQGRTEYAKAPEKSYTYDRTYLAPFYYFREKITDGGVQEKHHTVWPLASWTSDADSKSFNLLKLFPCNRGDAIARNWEPLWTLYGSYTNTQSGDQERRVLGPLYSSRTNATRDTSETNCLFYQYRRNGTQRSVSLLFGCLPVHF
jgi:hypothetical protein